jgi:hypothetical protein
LPFRSFKFERKRIIEEVSGVANKDQDDNREKAVKTPPKIAKQTPKTPEGEELNTPMSNMKRKIEEEQEPNEDEADTIKNEKIAADEGAGASGGDGVKAMVE